MTCYESGESYDHKLEDTGGGDWRLTWVCDRTYEDSYREHPVKFQRDTDNLGAVKFCKKHGLTMPEVLEEWMKEQAKPRGRPKASPPTP